MGMTVQNVSAFAVHITWQAQTFVLDAGETLELPLPRWNSEQFTVYPARRAFAKTEKAPSGKAKRALQTAYGKLWEQAEDLFLTVACTYTTERLTESAYLTVSVAEYDIEDRFTDELAYRYCTLSAENAACMLSSCRALEEKRTLRALLQWKTVSETVWYGWIGLIVEYPMLLHRFRYYCRPQTIQTFLNSVQNTPQVQ